jgi:hypothetical protein
MEQQPAGPLDGENGFDLGKTPLFEPWLFGPNAQ